MALYINDSETGTLHKVDCTLKELEVAIADVYGQEPIEYTINDALYDLGWTVHHSADTVEKSLQQLIDDNFSDNEPDGQPDEAQEWHDFDPDC